MENITEPLVTVQELYKRWTGLYEEEIAWGIRDAVAEIQISDIRDFPTPYYLHKILFDASGKSIFVCVLLTDKKEPFLISNPAPERIVFRLSDIEAYERIHPEVLYAMIPSTEGCDSPPEETNRIAELECQLAAALQGKQDAEANLARLQAERVENLPPQLTRTQKASLARQEKALKEWKPAIAAMIKVAVRCGEEGARPRQQPALNTLFNLLDATLTESQMIFFRQSLPDEHVDRTGGVRGKGYPPLRP